MLVLKLLSLADEGPWAASSARGGRPATCRERERKSGVAVLGSACPWATAAPPALIFPPAPPRPASNAQATPRLTVHDGTEAAESSLLGAHLPRQTLKGDKSIELWKQSLHLLLCSYKNN